MFRKSPLAGAICQKLKNLCIICNDVEGGAEHVGGAKRNTQPIFHTPRNDIKLLLEHGLQQCQRISSISVEAGENL
jgi:hypothetical protein